MFLSGYPRWIPPTTALLVVALAALGGCTTGEEGLGLGLKASPAPSAGDVTGGITTGGGTTQASPTPGASATPAPTPTPAPYAIALTVTPATAQLSVPAGTGTGTVAGYPTSVQLSALVTMSNGSTSNSVTWVSSNPDVAWVVPTTGLVTIMGPGTGTGPWNVQIQAISADQKKTGVANITVTAEGEVTLNVE